MLYLHELAKQEAQQRCVTLQDRVPGFIVSPCQLNATYQVQDKGNYFLIQLTVTGPLTVLCQRCMQEFELAYHNETVLAVTRTDAHAEQLLEQYECIVSSNGRVNLDELIIDELHLYVPQFHQELKDCDPDINQFLTEEFVSN